MVSALGEGITAFNAFNPFDYPPSPPTMQRHVYLRRICFFLILWLASASAWAESVTDVTISPTAPQSQYCPGAALTVSFTYAGFNNNNRNYEIDLLKDGNFVQNLVPLTATAAQTGSPVTQTGVAVTLPTSLSGTGYALRGQCYGHVGHVWLPPRTQHRRQRPDHPLRRRERDARRSGRWQRWRW